jgi:hypothetical protein
VTPVQAALFELWACEREKDMWAAEISSEWRSWVYGIYVLPGEGEKLKDYARHLRRYR